MDGVCYATSELKEMAGEVDYPDGVVRHPARVACALVFVWLRACERFTAPPPVSAQDEMGEPVTRPGKTFDYMPNPYESEDVSAHELARALLVVQDALPAWPVPLPLGGRCPPYGAGRGQPIQNSWHGP